MSTKIRQKCPREFTEKCPQKSKKRTSMDKSVHENSPKVFTIIHPFCSHKFPLYVHEKSATLWIWLFVFIISLSRSNYAQNGQKSCQNAPMGKTAVASVVPLYLQKKEIRIIGMFFNFHTISFSNIYRVAISLQLLCCYQGLVG